MATIFQERMAEIRRAKHEAFREAKDAFPWVRSRGVVLATASHNEQCEPSPAADGQAWDGTNRQIESMIADVLKNHPTVDQIYLEGGYDGAETFEILHSSEYEPWIANWQVTVWRSGRQRTW